LRTVDLNAEGREESCLSKGPAPAETLESEPRLSVGLDVARHRIHRELFGSAPDTLQVGRYKIEEPLGSGAMGAVYRAEDPELCRSLAIKVIRRADVSEAMRARFIREARALARVNHPNVVTVHDVGEHEQQTFIAMEFVRGKTLREWLCAKKRPWPQVMQAYFAAGRGLAAAHAAGLVHRDFKPTNVVVADDGRIVVVDFGLARRSDEFETPAEIDDEGTAGPPRQRDPLGVTVTRTGTRMGTPAYMSPEQLQGEPTDARSDQFSFCAALYEGLFGQRPFEGETVEELAVQVVDGRLRSPDSCTTIPARVFDVLRRGLSVDPHARFEAMDALLHALDRATRPRRSRFYAVAVALVALAGAAGTKLAYSGGG
jgi:serine/threonine protein kinase